MIKYNEKEVLTKLQQNTKRLFTYLRNLIFIFDNDYDDYDELDEEVKDEIKLLLKDSEELINKIENELMPDFKFHVARKKYFFSPDIEIFIGAFKFTKRTFSFLKKDLEETLNQNIEEVKKCLSYYGKKIYFVKEEQICCIDLIKLYVPRN